MDVKQMDRRRFLENSALATAGLSVVPRRVSGGTGHQAPSDTLNVAGIGVGGWGTFNMNALASGNIVAICDIDYNRADQSLRNDEGNISKGYKALHTAYEQAERSADYRVMLDEMGDQIDAVVISTPDYLHAVAAQRAMEMDKHVYVEKPLTRTIREARILRETAERTNHQMNWADACKGQAEASCPFEYAVPLTETMLPGGVSLQAGRPIRYDQQSMEISNAPEAEQYPRPDCRDGWSL